MIKVDESIAEQLYDIGPFVIEGPFASLLPLSLLEKPRDIGVKVSRMNGASVIHVHGVLFHRLRGVDITSTMELARKIREEAQARTDRIILDFESPGGEFSGIESAAQAIREASLLKPVIGVINSRATSGAYWLASQCQDLAITHGGVCGAIGVMAIHANRVGQMRKRGVDVKLIHAGKHKIEGNTYEPLAAEARDNIQRDVNTIYVDFVHAVARGRSAPSSVVMNRYGKGRTVHARKAVQMGMADRVATLQDVISERPRRLTGAQARARHERLLLH